MPQIFYTFEKEYLSIAKKNYKIQKYICENNTRNSKKKYTQKDP